MTLPIVITFFNHKGGVGKTTGLREIACILSKEFGKRVLMIDADPQCNLTSEALYDFFLKRGIAIKEAEDPDFVYDDLSSDEQVDMADELVEIGEANYREGRDGGTRSTIRTLEEFLEPVVSDSVNETTIDAQVAKVELVHLRQYGELFILPGDFDLYEIEPDIATGIRNHAQFPLYKKVPGAICNSLRRLAIHNNAKVNFDIVLVDLNPGINALNEAFLMGSDYYIIPALADYYSRRAIYSFSKVLYNWNEQLAPLRGGSASSAPAQAVAPSFVRQPVDRQLPEFFKMPPMPRFLGYVCQRVKLRKPEGKKQRKPVKVYESELVRLRKQFTSYLLKVASTTDGFHLPLTPVIPESHSFGVAATRSGEPLSYAGRLQDAASVQRRVAESASDFRNRYIYILKQLIANMSKEDRELLGIAIEPNKTLRLRVSPAVSAMEETSALGRRKRGHKVYYCGSENLPFVVVQNNGSGNCLFEAITVERHTVYQTLMRNFAHINRDELLPEIADSIYSDHFTPDTQALREYKQNSKDYDELLDQYHREYADTIRQIPLTTVIPEALKNPDNLRDLTSFLDEHLELDENFYEKIDRLTDLHRQVLEKNAALNAFLKSDDVIKAYLQKMGQDGFWGGTKIAGEYARITRQFNIVFWHKKANREGDNLEVFSEQQVDPSLPTLNILYQGGWHFERLEPHENIYTLRGQRRRHGDSQAQLVGSSQQRLLNAGAGTASSDEEEERGSPRLKI
jgi:cellulose biosynthesis protein BcsQ